MYERRRRMISLVIYESWIDGRRLTWKVANGCRGIWKHGLVIRHWFPKSNVHHSSKMRIHPCSIKLWRETGKLGALFPASCCPDWRLNDWSPALENRSPLLDICSGQSLSDKWLWKSECCKWNYTLVPLSNRHWWNTEGALRSPNHSYRQKCDVRFRNGGQGNVTVTKYSCRSVCRCQIDHGIWIWILDTLVSEVMFSPNPPYLSGAQHRTWQASTRRQCWGTRLVKAGLSHLKKAMLMDGITWRTVERAFEKRRPIGERMERDARDKGNAPYQRILWVGYGK